MSDSTRASKTNANRHSKPLKRGRACMNCRFLKIVSSSLSFSSLLLTLLPRNATALSQSVVLANCTRETTSASTRMARAGRERRCWRIRCLGWRRDSSSWRIRMLQRLPSSYMIHIALTPNVSLIHRPCTSRKHLSSSAVSFLHFRLPLRLQVFLLVGTGSHFQRSRQTLNPQARAVHRLRQSDFLFLCHSQVMRSLFFLLLS